MPTEMPPPIPLSQMTIEELMQILPSLDAAVIAHDWMPCLQKRQRELKTWLQNNKANTGTTESLRYLDKVRKVTPVMHQANTDQIQNLSNVFDRSEDIAQTFYQLFEIAKKLQSRDDQKKDAEIYEATAQKSEALIALSRQIALQEETAAHHEREMNAYKDKTYQIINTLRAFIKEHLHDAMRYTSQSEIQELLNTLIEAEDRGNHSSRYVPTEVYISLQNTCRKAQEERDSRREVCTEQMKTIRQQSQDLDQYIERTERVVDLLRERERQNQELKAENTSLRNGSHPRPNSVTIKPKVQPAPKLALDEDFDEELWARDAEITNLRRKLDKSCTREKELQNQIRQLLQDSNIGDQVTADKPPSRLKRLLGGPQKSSPSIPTMNSMQNLSSSIFTSFTKDRGATAQAPSPSPKNGRMSPIHSALCDSNNIDHLELPRAHQSFRSRHRDFSPQSPPRIREAASHDEIDDAVSGRFHQMPSHIRSTASTPTSSGQSSYVEVPDYPQRSRPRFDSEPSLTRSEQSLGQFPAEPYTEGRQMLAERHNRVLSGITEVTEEGTSSIRRQSAATGSPDSSDRQVYLESIDAERALGQRY